MNAANFFGRRPERPFLPPVLPGWAPSGRAYPFGCGLGAVLPIDGEDRAGLVKAPPLDEMPDADAGEQQEATG